MSSEKPPLSATPASPKVESNTPAWIALAVIVVAAIVGVVIWKTHHGSGIAKVDTGQLEQTIGAAVCTDSGYYLVNRIDNSKAEVYNCSMQSGPDKCVTDEGGIARDVTATAKLTFANTLGAQDKPQCAQ